MKRLFLISLPRSGSTLTQAILSSAPEIATTPEPWTQLIISSFSQSQGIKADYNWSWALRALEGCRGEQDTLLEDFKNGLIEREDAFAQRELACQGATIFLDKTPRYYYILDELKSRYPDAHFLILDRDLVSVCMSIYRTWVMDKSKKNILNYMDDLLVGPELIKNFAKTNADSPNVMSISYEKILESPDEHFREIFAWLKISWDKKYLDFSKNDKFRGAFGDQTRVNEGVLRTGKTKKLESSKKGKYVDDFFGDSFIRGYAYYIKRKEDWFTTNRLRARPTLVFFLLYSANLIRSEKMFKDKIKQFYSFCRGII